MSESIIVWFRQDLRLEDNPALYKATKTGLNIIPLFIWSPETEGRWRPGSASMVWLHHSLISLNNELLKLDSKLIIVKGDVLESLTQLIRKHTVTSVYWNRRYEPRIIKRDTIIKNKLQKIDVDVESFNGSLLYEPQSIYNKQGNPYKVYTAFWNTTQAISPPEQPLPKPGKIKSSLKHVKSLDVSKLKLLPAINWHRGIENYWQPGAAESKKRLQSFLNSAVKQYGTNRDYPAEPGVSLLSPYLHFGEISPNIVWHAVKDKFLNEALSNSVIVFLKQLVWREFAHHLLFHFPHTDTKPLREEFNHFPWKKNKRLLTAWQKGETGYPIVDAGMRELWSTGWMHNRVRMIVASFLIKDCLIHWRDGAEWFWDTLVDADLANNTMGWQWVAGSGADASPYFRIFNPITQGERFDPEGKYIRKWLPELEACTNQLIHKPWQSSAFDMQMANIKLGKDYPKPILDHSVARKQALDALKVMKNKNAAQ